MCCGGDRYAWASLVERKLKAPAGRMHSARTPTQCAHTSISLSSIHSLQSEHCCQEARSKNRLLSVRILEAALSSGCCTERSVSISFNILVKTEPTALTTTSPARRSQRCGRFLLTGSRRFLRLIARRNSPNRVIHLPSATTRKLLESMRVRLALAALMLVTQPRELVNGGYTTENVSVKRGSIQVNGKDWA